MSHKVNLVRVFTSATGNSTPITLGSAYSQLFMTPAEAGAMDGRVYTYLIVDGNDWEMGRGAYTASGTSLARTTIIASRISGTLGTSRITLTGTAQVRFVESAEDMDGVRGTRAVTSTSDVLANSDQGYVVTYSNAAAVAVLLGQASASNLFLAGWATMVQNLGAGTVTITPTTSTINGSATLTLATGMGAFIWSDGTNYRAYFIPASKPLLAANNLSDGNAATMLTNLGGTTVGKSLFNATDETVARTSIFAAPFDALAYNGMQINGSCEISEDIGTTATAIGTGTRALDCWAVSKKGTMVATVQKVADAPPGFTSSLKVAVTTGQSSLGADNYLAVSQLIEGYRVRRLGFGAAGASPLAFGFWVKAHRAGAYSGCLANGANDRSCPFSFTVNSADTWEFKTVSIAGDTTGTWNSTNGIGLEVSFTVAAGADVVISPGWISTRYRGVTGTTNGVAASTDTFQITGLVVLPGLQLPTAEQSPFIMRPTDMERIACLRYFEAWPVTAAYVPFATGQALATTSAQLITFFKAIKRVAPTMAISNAGDFVMTNSGGTTLTVTSLSASFSDLGSATLLVGVASGLVAGNATGLYRNNNNTCFMEWDSRL